MKQLSELNQRPSEERRKRSLLAAAVSAFVLVSGLVAGLVSGAVWANGEAGAAAFGGSGGDSIGSLPLTAPGGTEVEGAQNPALAGPLRPSFVLVGREADLIAVLLDATANGPDAGYCSFALPDGRLRLEFYGQLTLLLDQGGLMSRPVTGQIRVGSSFLGGLATLTVGSEPRGVQVLPLGNLPLPLQQLSSSGVLLLGMEWNATAPGGLKRVLDVRQDGAVIRLQQSN